jgi:hypothetical protein
VQTKPNLSEYEQIAVSARIPRPRSMTGTSWSRAMARPVPAEITPPVAPDREKLTAIVREPAATVAPFPGCIPSNSYATQ